MPPTLKELLDDPLYRLYILRVPKLPENIAWGEPWMVWAVTHDGRWGKRLFASYQEAWAKTVELHKQPEKFRDVALVSRRMLFPPPSRFVWKGRLYAWCSRCRRPSEFRLRAPDHHALRGQPTLTDDNSQRCYYCGIRKIAMPEYFPGWDEEQARQAIEDRKKRREERRKK